jgi:hypothetical protein
MHVDGDRPSVVLDIIHDAIDEAGRDRLSSS